MKNVSVIFFVSMMLFSAEQPPSKKFKPGGELEEVIEKLQGGGVVFVRTDLLEPGQIRYSKKNTALKLKKFQNSERASSDHSSFLSEENPIPVILGPGSRIITVDGHHEVMAHLQDNKFCVPIKKVEDFSQLQLPAFWVSAESKGYVYPYDIDGKEVSLDQYTWKDLQNDPLRWFMAITCLRLKNKKTPFKQAECRAAKDSYASKHPLWIKFEDQKNETPFIDLKVADILYQAGFSYDEDQYNDNPPEKVIEDARKILADSQKVKGLQGFILNTFDQELTEELLEKITKTV